MSLCKNILITGGARGIGRGLARHLLSSGHRVFLLDNNASELQYTANVHLPPFTTSPTQLGHTICDLQNPSSITAAIAEAKHFFAPEKLDVLINNAAIANPHWPDGKDMADPSFDVSQWDSFLATNLTAPFLMARGCIPFLRRDQEVPEDDEHGESWGSIINISSSRAHQSEPNTEGYAATKAGLVGLTHAMAVSLSKYHVTVNAILPGWIDVSMENQKADEEGWTDETTPEDQEWHLSRRVGRVEDISRTVEWVMGTRFVNGQEVLVDGGVGRKMVYPE
jgi:NAD(P)-dependent dehydrogenase (short-subunit alcohol dehydrogenase family)